MTFTVSLLWIMLWRNWVVLVLAGDVWEDFLCLALAVTSVGEVCRERLGVTGELW